MNSKRVLSLLTLIVVVVNLMPAAVGATPLEQSTNLLNNGGLEPPQVGMGTDLGVATSWQPWWSEETKPADGSFNYTFKPKINMEIASSGAAPAAIYSGGASQRLINSWDPYYGGVKQVVSAPAGSRVKLTAYGRLWASDSSSFPADPSDTGVGAVMRVGLEPNGSDNQFVGTVVWSGGISPHNGFQAVSVETTVGSSGKVTAILSASYRGFSKAFMMALWDEASLVVVGQGQPQPANTQPVSGGNPTSAPVVVATRAPAVLPTANADGNIIYVVQAGDTLWYIAGLVNSTPDQIKALNGLSSDIISTGQRLVIAKSQTTSPTAAPTEAVTTAPTTAPAENGQPTTAAETQVAVVNPGDPAKPTGTICAMLYLDENGNGGRDSSEGLVAGGQFAVVDTATGLPVQVYTTDGVSEPHCFTNLPIGTYAISSAPPTGYNATTEASRAMQLDAGVTVSIEFGAQAGSAAPVATETTSSQRLRTALLAAAGIVFILLAAGIAGFLVLRRAQ